MQILQFGEKLGLSHWPLLGKNFREFLGLRSFDVPDRSLPGLDFGATY
jgi:hypothetical protein